MYKKEYTHREKRDYHYRRQSTAGKRSDRRYSTGFVVSSSIGNRLLAEGLTVSELEALAAEAKKNYNETRDAYSNGYANALLDLARSKKR